MDLSCWRKSRQYTLAKAAKLLGIQDANPARTLHRFERGERRPSAILVARIEALTEGEVTAADLHERRLAWERARAAR